LQHLELQENLERDLREEYFLFHQVNHRHLKNHHHHQNLLEDQL
tara:strand:+ start:272 stop:403 length:132 start_codon:yes stop_codon:yes gene_type:complete